MIIDEIDCGTQGGTWHVDWTSCDPNPCVVDALDDPSGSSSATALLSVRANPFRGTTHILFRLASETMVTISIYEAGGRIPGLSCRIKCWLGQVSSFGMDNSVIADYGR